MASIYDIPLAFGADTVTVDMVLQISVVYLGLVMIGPVLQCMLIGQKRCDHIQPFMSAVAVLALITLMMNLGVGFITALTLTEQTRKNANVRRLVWTFILGFLFPILFSFLRIQWYVLLPFCVLGFGIAPIIATFTTPVLVTRPSSDIDRDFVNHVSAVMKYAKENIKIEDIKVVYS